MALGQGSQDPLRTIDRRALKPGAFPIGKAIRRAEANMKKMDELLDRAGFADAPDHPMPSRQLIGGQISNVQAHLYQTSRHTKETIVEITSTPASQGEVASWLSGLAGNAGHFQLSITSHIRASQRTAVWQAIQRRVKDPQKRITHLGIVVPPGSESSISPKGILSRYLGGVFKVEDWMKIARRENKRRGSMSLAFSLGLHHGDPSYLVPITPAKLGAMSLAFRKYRKGLQKSAERRHKGEE